MRLDQELDSDGAYVTFHAVDHEYECHHWDDEPKYSLPDEGYVINSAFILEPCSGTELPPEVLSFYEPLYSPVLEVDSPTDSTSCSSRSPNK